MSINDKTNIKVHSCYPYLVIFSGKDSGKRFKVKPGIMTIGRSSQADIRLDDVYVSRIHCTIKRSDDVITIEDTGSTNGTYIDSCKISHSLLAAGIPFQLGRSLMQIEYKDETKIEFEQSLGYKVAADSLTGMFNRQHFSNLVSKEIEFACRYQQTVGIILIGIDNLEFINDTYGHSRGNWIMLQLADIIRENRRAEDILGRYGRSKFIIFPRRGVNKEEIYRQCKDIREAVEKFKSCYSDDTSMQVIISIGFHFDRLDNGKVYLLIDDLIDKAERKLYLDRENNI